MAEPVRKVQASLYEQDFASWADYQGRVLRDRSTDRLDWDNLAEEIESLGRRDKSEIRSRLIVLLMHLLKWHFQPSERGHSRQSTIGEQRIHLESMLEDSPSLKRFPGEVLQSCYERARMEAAKETKLPLGAFPEDAPYSVEQVLDYRFMPGRPWSPDELS
jgi:hypothetical protein